MTSLMPPQSDATELAQRLTSRSEDERKAAAGALRTIGATAVEPLCEMLKHRDPIVRARAASVLGEIGDARAVQPLIEALREGFVKQSPKWQYRVGLFVNSIFLAQLPIQIAIWISHDLFPNPDDVWRRVGFIFVCAVVGAVGFTVPLCRYWKRRYRYHQVCYYVAEALRRIAERDPVPELRAAIPDLICIEKDFRQYGDTQQVAREALQRIQNVAEHLKSLPIPSDAPAPDVKELPIPVSATAVDEATLPRPYSP